MNGAQQKFIEIARRRDVVVVELRHAGQQQDRYCPNRAVLLEAARHRGAGFLRLGQVENNQIDAFGFEYPGGFLAAARLQYTVGLRLQCRAQRRDGQIAVSHQQNRRRGVGVPFHPFGRQTGQETGSDVFGFFQADRSFRSH